MQKPLVSIITPCYNGETYLDRFFESILNQTYSNLELIFINDGSRDRTGEIANSYKKRIQDKGIRFVYLEQENAGQAAALNRGLQVFTGEYLTWPDSDDVMAPDCIEKKVSYLQDNPSYHMVRSNGIYFDEETKEKKRISDSPSNNKEDIFEALLLLKTFGCCGCYMITRGLFERIYPERRIFESRQGQNWQILVPASSYSKCGYIDEDLYVVYEQEKSHSRKQRTKQQEIERWDGFTEILLDAIERSNCSREYFGKLVKENCARNQFYYAVYYGDKDLLKIKFAEIKKYGKTSWKEKLLFVKHMLSGKKYV